jgi:Amt family ammonium transporter
VDRIEKSDACQHLQGRQCFVAKEGGRNRVHVSLPDDEEVLKHRGQMQWVSRIRDALEENRFSLVFEPVVDLKASDAPLRHYEILSRMQDGEGGVVLPNNFVPAAERYQLMGAVDLNIVQKLLAFLSEQPLDLLRPDTLSVAVNLSGTSLGSPALLESLRAAIKLSAVPPQCLMFEITETAAITHLEESVRWMNQLRELGCRFALDDFGAGLSSYAYLKNLPIDYLKIDGAFIRKIDQDPLSRAIVASITDIGHQMGLRIVAEHVETEAILEAVRRVGVDYAQGYRVGRAKPLNDLARLLREK